MSSFDLSPVFSQINTISQANYSKMDKTERANVEFQTFLLKEIYLKSLVAKSELMNDDEEEEANEDRDSNIPNLSKGQVDTYNDIMTNNLAYKLAKEDVFGFNRVLQKRGPSL